MDKIKVVFAASRQVARAHIEGFGPHDVVVASDEDMPRIMGMNPKSPHVEVIWLHEAGGSRISPREHEYLRAKGF